MNRTIKWLLPVLIFACFTACDEKKGKNNAEKEESPIETTTEPEEVSEELDFEVANAHHVETLYRDQEYPGCEVGIQAVYAKGESELAKQVNTTICQLLFHRTSTDVKRWVDYQTDSLTTAFIDEIGEYYDPTEEDDMGMLQYSYFKEGTCNSESLDGYLVYQMRIEQYLGGAHGMYEYYYANIRKSDGRQIRANDVFDLDHEDEIVLLMLQQLMLDNNCDTYEQLVDELPILFMEGFSIRDNNFLLLPEGVRFHFNPYEVSSFSTGCVDVEISYEQLKDYLIL